jgi:hypothetical protein
MGRARGLSGGAIATANTRGRFAEYDEPDWMVAARALETSPRGNQPWMAVAEKFRDADEGWDWNPDKFRWIYSSTADGHSPDNAYYVVLSQGNGHGDRDSSEALRRKPCFTVFEIFTEGDEPTNIMVWGDSHSSEGAAAMYNIMAGGQSVFDDHITRADIDHGLKDFLERTYLGNPEGFENTWLHRDLREPGDE